MTTDTKDITAMTLRLPASLKRRIRVAAASEDKTATKWIVEALELVVTHQEAKDA